MAFSSIQAYLDSSNWKQPPQSSYLQATGAATSGSGGAHILSPRPPLPPPPPPLQQPHGSIRPGSMADRARLENIQMPEVALKCPRCESTNTKFCYFNNYSLKQPRHFCKNCRRYWTRGGTLRNVPVGGGCRRNRRTRSHSGSGNASGGQSSTVGAMVSSNYGHHEGILSQILSPVRLMSSSFNDLTAANAADGNIGGLLNYGIVSGVSNQDLSSINVIGSSLSGGGGGDGGGSLMSCVEQWRLSQPSQPLQLPALGCVNMENSSYSSPGLYAFEAANKDDESGYVRPLKISSNSISSALASQLASVKVEDSPYKWGSNGTFSPWTDISSFGSSG